MGNTIPRYTFGLDLSAQYRDFDFRVFLQGVGKRDHYLRDDLAWAFNAAGKIQKWQKEGMWQEGETNAKYPRLFISSANNTTPSTFWLENGAYLRLKNVQIGYNIPDKILKDQFIKGIRLFFAGQNVFTFKKMTEGYDPEQSDNNARYKMPLVKTYSFGFNLNF